MPSHHAIGVCRFTGALSALLLIPACQSTFAPKPTPQRLEAARVEVALQLAEQHVSAGEFERARRSLAPYETLHNPDVAIVTARVDLEEGRYALALDRLAAVSGPPAVAPAQINDVLSGKAAPDHTLATPQQAQIEKLSGIACEGLGRWPEAMRHYAAAYRIQPDVQTLLAWLETLVLDGDVDTALTVLETERAHYPGDAALNVLAGRLRTYHGDAHAAIAELTTAALTHADGYELLARLASAYEAAGDYRRAAEQWRRTLDGLTANPSERTPDGRRRELYVRKRLAADALLSGDYREAQRGFQLLTALTPTDRDARLGLAAAQLGAGAVAQALEAVQAVLQRDPQDASARLLASICHEQLGQPVGRGP